MHLNQKRSSTRYKCRANRRAVYYIDAVVGILLLIVGILTFIIGIDYLWQLKPSPYYTIPSSYYLSGYLIIVLGLAGVIYGIKRTIDDIAKGIQPRE